MKDNLIATKTFDFALAIIDLYIKLKKENEFIFAGANTIVYHISNKQINTIKGNKHPIGGFYGEQLQPFQNTKHR